jgi:hypothetical protein
MEFKGRTGNKEIRVLSDKRNKQFQTFSAFSKEASVDNATFIWVHFLNFSPDKAAWLKPATSISVRGTLDLKLYNNNLDLGCQVKEITEWKFEEKKTEEVQH